MTSPRPDATEAIAQVAPVAGFPQLRVRGSDERLLDLPWELPLGEWPTDTIRFKQLPVGPSRHLVRFLCIHDRVFALKELPLEVAQREFEVLRHLEGLGLPAVRALGLSEAPERNAAVLITEYLEHSLQYRRLMMRFPIGPGPYRSRLLDAMAWLLVDLHRAGVYWGDCSLANTLFRRDGDKIQAFLVDAETGEIHPSLSDGQRAYDLDILVENVAFGLADLAAFQKRDADLEEAIPAAESVRDRYIALWDELHQEPKLQPGDRFAVRQRIRRLNDLGFAVDEIRLEPSPDGAAMRLRMALSNRRFHARELERLTGLAALEGQARLLLNDLREYRVWLEFYDRRAVSEDEAAGRWVRDVLEPSLARLVPVIGPDRDTLQAYCDVLEEKWIQSERAGRDVGLDAAIASYIAGGAPAPEDGSAATEQDDGQLTTALET
jgi:tRNA A-37 threonylcarbamoyl transferase component Bud32